MRKTQEELRELKNEYESFNKKLNELTDDELVEVTGGMTIWDIAVKLKEKFNINVASSNRNNGLLTNIGARGKNGKPTLPLWDEASGGLINDPNDSK